MSTPLELLAPAGDARIGMAAIDHGADAVYIGAPQFSARAQAGSSIEDIARLIEYAHLFHARVYVALNTILTDSEIPAALAIIRAVHAVGADAMIVQDMGLLELDLPPIPLIASTQMHCTTPEKVRFLEAVGFRRVILARELSLAEIAEIRDRTTVELECFVHGALCVSYSGQCYMSQHAFGRSGNRGVCAQPCRHSYTLTDGQGVAVLKDKCLLCLKDMNRLDALPDLAAAGVTSFKIEGRYKEMDYVKNVTAAYRQALDRLIDADPAYGRAAGGRCSFDFQPDLEKTFNRGYCEYFLRDGRRKIASLDTPKSMGQFAGTVTAMGRDFFRMRGMALVPGDGLCFFTSDGTLAGCKVDRVGADRIYPNTLKDLAVGARIFRNLDQAFARALRQSTRCRTISVSMAFVQEAGSIALTVMDEDGVQASHRQAIGFEPAREPARARTAVQAQLTRSGDTPFRVAALTIMPEQPGFVGLSVLNELRRKALASLAQTRVAQHHRPQAPLRPNDRPYPENELDYRTNVLNSYAEKFYARHGARLQERALEARAVSKRPKKFDRPVMTTRYCLRHELDACLKSDAGQTQRLKPPLRISDNKHTFRLEFDCEACRMKVIPE